tara:strand:+ start:554 stop:913 length:360 start_codon:yes stop_codon:yes gene_type:complete
MLEYTLLNIVLLGATWPYYLLAVISVLICIALVFVIMVQNPKGGGLSSTFGGGNQVLGARKTSDFLEKSTWILAITLVSITLLASFFIESQDNNTAPPENKVTNSPPNEDPSKNNIETQ